MIIFQPWEPTFIHNEASHTKDRILSHSPGRGPSAQGIFRASQITHTRSQAGVYMEQWLPSEEPFYPPKGWSWSPKEIPVQVIFHKHFLEESSSSLLSAPRAVVDALGQLRDTGKGRTVYSRGAPIYPSDSIWVLSEYPMGRVERDCRSPG